MKAYKRTSRKIGCNIIDRTPLTLLGLNDGRLAIGTERELIIYNMKTYNTDIKIEDRKKHLFLLQLKDNRLFCYNQTYETEGGAVDIYFYNTLIELSAKEYKDKTSILPESSKYNILREFSDKILYGGINYYDKELTRSYTSTNAVGPNRIEKIIKTDEVEKSDRKEKYEIVTSLQIDFIDFIAVQENIIAVLKADSLSFYDVDKIFNLNTKIKVKDGTKISYFNDKYLLYGTKKAIIIFDHINYKYVKSLPLIYSLRAIYVKENTIFVGESALCYDFKTHSDNNGIGEYEIDDNGNYKQLSYITNGHKNTLNDVTIVKDGRLISCSIEDVKIWS